MSSMTHGGKNAAGSSKGRHNTSRSGNFVANQPSNAAAKDKSKGQNIDHVCRERLQKVKAFFEFILT
jgi:hypothetical protein